jgi:hypothetical protein
VIEVQTGRGKGVEADIFRVVTQYWSFDGFLLAEHDPCSTSLFAVEPKKTKFEWTCRHVKTPSSRFCVQRVLDHDDHQFYNLCGVDDKPCRIKRAK